jgi:hypothetical protein
MAFDPKQQRQQQPEQQKLEQPKMKTVCVLSRATFGHHFHGYHLPRNKAVLIEIPAADFDTESQAPVYDSELGKQLRIYPGLLEHIEETDVRCTGGKNPQTGAETKPAELARKIETVKVCAFSMQPHGHYRAREFWPPTPQAPIVYEVPKSMLRELEADKRLNILSPSRPDENGQRHYYEPPNAISGAAYFGELHRQQEQEAADMEIWQRVEAKKKADEARKRRISSATAS